MDSAEVRSHPGVSMADEPLNQRRLPSLCDSNVNLSDFEYAVNKCRLSISCSEDPNHYRLGLHQRHLSAIHPDIEESTASRSIQGIRSSSGEYHEGHEEREGIRGRSA